MDLYSDCLDKAEILELAQHIVEQGDDAGFSTEQIIQAQHIVAALKSDSVLLLTV